MDSKNTRMPHKASLDIICRDTSGFHGTYEGFGFTSPEVCLLRGACEHLRYIDGFYEVKFNCAHPKVKEHVGIGGVKKCPMVK